MSYIGAQPTTAAFVTDTFSANGSGTVFTLSVAPANTNSILVAVSGVLQDPSTYSVSGTTLTFSAAPPAGTGNISVRFLGIPASGVVNTAYRTQTEFTATAGQTTFSVPSYTVGFIDVYRNGALLGSADFTATNGTTVVLANPASSGDLVETISFFVSSVLNAIPAVANAVTTSSINNGAVTAAKMAASGAWAPVGTVVQVVNSTYSTQTTSGSSTYADTGLTATITPTSITSKILVLASQNGNLVTGYSTGTAIQFRLLRGASVIAFLEELNSYQGDGSGIGRGGGSTCISYLDSPATTSATTYKTQFANRAPSGTMYIQFSGSVSSMTLMEIAA